MKSFGKTTNYCRWTIVGLILAGAVMSSQAAWSTIHNDFFQIDQNGDPVHTRSGCLRKFNDTYYWYGSAGGFTDQTCYSSPDLMHWTYKGVAIKAAGTNRMDVVYNDSTKQYVMSLKTQNGTNCDMGIATCSTPDGQFALKGNYKVFGYQVGDPSVYQDDDGKAYYLFVWDSVPGANSGDKSEHAIALDVAGLFECVPEIICMARGQPRSADDDETQWNLLLFNVSDPLDHFDSHPVLYRNQHCRPLYDEIDPGNNPRFHELMGYAMRFCFHL